MIKRPILLFTILIVIGLIVIVTYKMQTDPFNKDPKRIGQENTPTNNDNVIYTIYLENCVTCHGRNGEGQSGFPSLQKTRLNVDEIKQLITTGRGDMPAFPSISEPQLSQLAKIVKQFSD